jgi:crotonobetainyl-CoA:carnitine CoA-transferase CaiB-like acyl-CoA transferase
MGARVIKIERPDGGDFARGYDASVRGYSSFFVWLNRSKESVALDLKTPDGLRILERLIGRADVFVQNLAPGAADRLGLDAASLRARDPRLVVCNVSGYGPGGPFRDKRAYDLLVQAEAAVPAITGTPDTPSKVGFSVADISAGMYAFSSILLALFARERGGVGATLDVSLFDSIAEWMSAPAYFTRYSGREPTRAGLHHATIAPYGPVRCADGYDVIVAIQNRREWERFCARVLRDASLSADPRFSTVAARVEHRAELDALVGAACVMRTRDELERELDDAEIAHARANDVSAFVAHPQLAARERWREVESEVGPLEALLPPFFGLGEPRMDPIPALGEHTARVLAELGFDLG